jgi:SDR family mycofactocin-dependent oxidoreductase
MSGVAVVTGAARGIGAAVTRELAAQGWAVLAVDVCSDDESLPYALSTRADLDMVVAEAGADHVRPFVADVRSATALHDAVQHAVERYGGLDAAVACAGVIGGGRPQWDVDARTERTIVDVNLLGVLNLARAAIPALLDRPEPRAGRFVAIASAAGTRAMPNLAAYCAAKAGVVGAVRTLALELAGTGITANVVSPGSTDTPILAESARLYDLNGASDFAAQQPVGRLLRPAEIAAAVAFLVSERAAAFTGADVAVDGGLTL